MRFVVTGASGAIGRALIERLAGEQHAYLAVSRRTTGRAGSTLFVENYTDPVPVTKDDVIVHLGEESSIGRANERGADHVADVVNTVRALAERSPAHFVYTSSAAIYDDSFSGSCREDSPRCAGSTYVEAKLAAEAVVRAAGGTVLRLGNVYGLVPVEGTVFGDITAQLRKPGPLRVRKTFPVRDYVWLDDVADGLSIVAQSGVAGTFNLGSGIGWSVSQLAHMMLTLARQPDREIEGDENGFSSIVLDVAALQKAVGWRPKTPIEDGLKAMVERALGLV